MQKLLFALVLFFLSTCVFSQGKKLSMNDAVVGGYTYLQPEGIQRLNWRANTEYYTYVKDNVLKQSKPKSDKTEDIISLADLNTILKTTKIGELKMFPAFTWLSENSIQLPYMNHLLVINIKTKKLESEISFDDRAENIDLFTDKAAYTIDNNLFFTDKTGKTVQITSEADKGIVCGKSVHRNEFGILKGIFWSPLGNNIAFYRMDERMVTNYPLVDATTRIAEVKNIRYPMAGMKSHEVTLGIYNIATGKTIFMKTGEPAEQYLTNISWSPDEKNIYIAVLNREQNHMKLNCYNAETGEFVKTLFEEKNDRYVEPQRPLLFLKSKPGHFIWQSQKDGYNHLYLYSTDGKLVKQLTKGEWVVIDIIGTDEKEEFIYYTSTAASPVERQLYKVAINSGLVFRITKEEGWHNTKVSASGKYIFDSYSNSITPRIVNLLTDDGKVVTNLLTAKNPLKDFDMPKGEIVTIKAADGKTDLYCNIIKPLDFDPNKKYPAIIYVYGGPHDQMIKKNWMNGVNLWQYYMAQNGFVMLTVDNRGTANRGFEFESVIHRKLGQAEVDDQMKGVEYLKSLGFVDMSRIGVHGWSYGGFMTISLLTKNKNVFKAGVAGGPVIDWKYYEIMYGERYMDTPEENPEGYKQASLLNFVKDLNARLLIIHGYLDDTVVLQHSLSYIEESIKQGVQVDYFLYPTHEHNVTVGPDRVHLMQKVTQYFNDFLK